jgi:hypothetical protein
LLPGLLKSALAGYYIEAMTDADDPPDLPDHSWLAKAREILRRRGVQDPAVIDAEVRHVDCGTQAVTLPRQTGVHLIIRRFDVRIQLPE